MLHSALWNESTYKELVILVMSVLVLLGFVLYFLQKKNTRLKSSWASLISWLIFAPVVLFMGGLPSPWPLILLTLIAIYSCKTFFKMVGMYHRHWFVLTTYLFVALSAGAIYFREDLFFNLAPVLFLGFLSLIPIALNQSQNMIQYLALSLLAFIFLGWSIVHLGYFLHWERGVYTIFYLYILSEFSESMASAGTRIFPKGKIFTNISTRFSLPGIGFSLCLTVLLGWGLRHLLPSHIVAYWAPAAIIVCICGRIGELILSVIRKDLGIRNPGVFIIGRNDVLSRIDKMIFVGPVIYHIYRFFEGHLPP